MVQNLASFLEIALLAFLGGLTITKELGSRKSTATSVTPSWEIVITNINKKQQGKYKDPITSCRENFDLVDIHTVIQETTKIHLVENMTTNMSCGYSTKNNQRVV